MRYLLLLLLPTFVSAQSMHGHDTIILNKTQIEYSANKKENIGEASFFVGNDYNKFKIRAEWENKEVYAEAYYSRYLTEFFDYNIGLGQDFDKNLYAQVGFEGILPYNIESRAHLLLGEEARLRLELHSDYYFTQKLYLKPKINIEQSLSENHYDTNINLGIYYKINKNISPFVNYRSSFKRFENKTEENAILFGINFWF